MLGIAGEMILGWHPLLESWARRMFKYAFPADMTA
jgi:hypothetical protein